MKTVISFGLLGMMAACCNTVDGSTTGGSTGGSTSAGASGTGTGASTTGGCAGNGNACSSLPNGASVTNVVDEDSVAPTPGGGGAPPDGTYYLTSASTYTGEGGAKGKTTETLQVTMQISGSGTRIVLVTDHDGCPSTSTGTLSFEGNQVILTTTCPAGQSGTTGYTSSSTTFTLFIPGVSPEGPDVVEGQVYTLQQ